MPARPLTPPQVSVPARHGLSDIAAFERRLASGAPHVGKPVIARHAHSVAITSATKINANPGQSTAPYPLSTPVRKGAADEHQS